MYKNEKNNSPSKLPQRVLVEQKSGTAIAVSTPSWLSLAKKSGKSHFPLSVVEQVYCRGIVSAKYHPKNTLEQQAFNRVDSFLHEGKAYELDQDLLMETPKVPDGRKHMSIIKSAIKGHEERNKPQQTDDSQQVNEDIGHVVGRVLRRVVFGAKKRRTPTKGKSVGQEAQELAARQERREKVKSLASELRAKQGQGQPRQGQEQLQTNPLKTTEPRTRSSRSSSLRNAVGKGLQQDRVKEVGLRYKAKRYAHSKALNRLAGATDTSDILNKNFASKRGIKWGATRRPGAKDLLKTAVQGRSQYDWENKEKHDAEKAAKKKEKLF